MQQPEGRRGVGAHDEQDAHVGLVATQRLDSVDRVGRAAATRSMSLAHPVDVAERGDGHLVAQLRRARSARRSSLRVARDRDDQLVEPEVVQGGVDRCDVADVRRVERPAEQPDPAQRHRVDLRTRRRGRWPRGRAYPSSAWDHCRRPRGSQARGAPGPPTSSPAGPDADALKQAEAALAGLPPLSSPARAPPAPTARPRSPPAGVPAPGGRLRRVLPRRVADTIRDKLKVILQMAWHSPTPRGCRS